MISTPKNSRRHRPNTLLQFDCSAYVAKANVRIDGSHIVGEWKHPVRLIRGGAAVQLVEDFANWPTEVEERNRNPRFRVIGADAEEICRFTERYGALEEAPPPEGSKGVNFRFSIHRWAIKQREFRWHWERLGRRGYPKHWKAHPKLASTASRDYGVGDETDGRFVRRGQKWLYELDTLWDFLLLSLHLYPPERLRKCHRPECKNPYFFARHLRENYCSTLCARWGQAKWKRQWWAEHGTAWRKRGGPS